MAGSTLACDFEPVYGSALQALRGMDIKAILVGASRWARATFERATARRRGALVLTCVVLLSLAYRLHVSRECSLWLDEAATHFDVLKPWPILLHGPEREHPPLMFLLVRIATDLFGTSETGLRSVSLLFGCLLLVAIYELCLELELTVWRSLIVVSTFALTPFFIEHATEARQYAMLVAFTTLATTRALRLLRGEQTIRDVVGLGVCVVFATALHYFGLAYALALLGAVALGLALRWKATSASWRAAVVGVLLVCLVPLGYLTLRLSALGRHYAVGTGGAATGPALNLALLYSIPKEFSFLNNELWRFVLEPGLAVVGLILVSRRLRGVARVLPLGLGLAPCAAALFISGQHFIAARYLAPSAVLYHLAACVTLFAAVDCIQLALARGKRGALQVPYVGGVMLICLVAARLHEYPSRFGIVGDDYRACQRYFLAKLAPDTGLVVYPGGFGDELFGKVYRVGARPIGLEKFRPTPGIRRYLIVENHSLPTQRQAKLISLVERHFGLTAEAWSALPLVLMPHSTYQPAVRAHLVELPSDDVPPPRRKRRPNRRHPHPR